MPISDYFSPDYLSARDQFCRLSEQAGATCNRYTLPELCGPKGEALSIDTALLGTGDETAALVVISGTHGIEGYTGSGCQAGFFADRLYESRPKSACTLLVHALNPHGFAYERRVNEDNVDLNRNFVNFPAVASSKAYEALHPLLVPDQWEGDSRTAADEGISNYIRREGMGSFQKAVSGGQYTRPEGLFYGGTSRTWSARTLLQLLREQLPKTVLRLIVLDLHTGLGPWAYGEPILIPCGSGDLARAKNWFGPEVRSLVAADSSDGDLSVSPELEGTLPGGFREALPTTEITYVALEFGTLPIPDVLLALRADHWAHARAPHDTRRRETARQAMRGAFFPANPAWRAAVYGRTADFIIRAFRASSA